MKLNLILSALFFSLFFQGTELYFYITNSIGFKPTWLTGAYQVSNLLLFIFISLRIKEYRQKVFKLGGMEILYLSFFVMVFYDIFSSKNQQNLPENILIYFSVYSLALAVARGLIFNQIRLICYFTNIIAVVTSLLLFGQVLSGSATFVSSGVRLATGLASNPIGTGYIGAYAFLTSLTLSIKATSLPIKLAFLTASLPGIGICLLSGTRSAFVFSIIGFIGIVITTLWYQLRAEKGSRIKTFLNRFIFKLSFSISLISICFIFLEQTILRNIKWLQPLFSTFNNGWNRINLLFSISLDRVKDRSILDRYELYNNALNNFIENPFLGGNIYSAGPTHNAFLQAASDFGILGIITFVLPFIYLWYRSIIQIFSLAKYIYFKSELWMVCIFCSIFLLEGTCLFLFHGDPYRNFISLSAVGVLIAFSRLNFVFVPKT